MQPRKSVVSVTLAERQQSPPDHRIPPVRTVLTQAHTAAHIGQNACKYGLILSESAPEVRLGTIDVRCDYTSTGKWWCCAHWHGYSVRSSVQRHHSLGGNGIAWSSGCSETSPDMPAEPTVGSPEKILGHSDQPPRLDDMPFAPPKDSNLGRHILPPLDGFAYPVDNPRSRGALMEQGATTKGSTSVHTVLTGVLEKPCTPSPVPKSPLSAPGKKFQKVRSPRPTSRGLEARRLSGAPADDCRWVWHRISRDSESGRGSHRCILGYQGPTPTHRKV